MVLFITAVAQSVAFLLTVEHIPHALAELMVSLAQTRAPGPSWFFRSGADPDGVGLGGGAGIDHLRALLCRSHAPSASHPCIRHRAHHRDGDRLVCAPIGLGLYGACMIGGVQMEQPFARS